ncbi:MAG: VWA domain-containing protein [Pseudomonadota bacterium]
MKRHLLLSAIALLSAAHAPLAAGCARDAMLVFDGSASMSEITPATGANTRIVDARRALRDALPRITPFRDVGLLVYGPSGADACTGIDLRLPPSPDASAAILDAIDALTPSGLTPLAASVEIAAEALDYTNRPAIVVLVTDGNETCGGRPCALAQHLVARAADLQIHVIGFRVFNDPFSWNSPEAETYDEGATVAKCLADHSGGLYVATETVDDLVNALRLTLGCTIIGGQQRKVRDRS